MSLPASIMITCVKLAKREPRNTTIAKIGGWNADSSRWQLSLEDAIAGIEQGRWSFYTLVDGRRVPVIVGKDAAGHKMLKAEGDGEQPSVLMSLPPLV